jgi:hypothetical protein
MDAESFLRLLALEGLGWKDIHATNLVAGQQVAVRLMDYIPASLMSKVRSLFGR